jgi:hypothetical protein
VTLRPAFAWRGTKRCFDCGAVGLRLHRQPWGAYVLMEEGGEAEDWTWILHRCDRGEPATAVEATSG